MSLVVLPSEADRHKVFYITEVPQYKTTGVPTHFPVDILLAQYLFDAEQQGCDTMVVEVKGYLPRAYAVRDVRALVEAKPDYYKPMVRTHPPTPAELAELKILQKLRQRGVITSSVSPDGLTLDDH